MKQLTYFQNNAHFKKVTLLHQIRIKIKKKISAYVDTCPGQSVVAPFGFFSNPETWKKDLHYNTNVVFSEKKIITLQHRFCYRKPFLSHYFFYFRIIRMNTVICLILVDSRSGRWGESYRIIHRRKNLQSMSFHQAGDL